MIKTLRKPRVGGVAVFDVGGTVLAGYVLAEKMDWSKPKTIVGMFVLGFLTHEVLGIKTQLNK